MSFRGSIEHDRIHAQPYGNVRIAIGYLHDLAVSDFTVQETNDHDPDDETAVGERAQRGTAGLKHMQRDAIFERSVLVVAHPDDENLWCSSVLRRVERVVLCYGGAWNDPTRGEMRRAAIAEHPLPNVVSLDITESGVLNHHNWRDPRPSPYGLTIRSGASGAARYRANYDALRSRLTEIITGARNVFTHNPWGEYGHEEHVQIHRAVTDLAVKHGCEVWFTNYASNESATMMARSVGLCGDECLLLPTDPALAQSIANVYKKHHCWTWLDDWCWFEQEGWIHYLPQPPMKPFGRKFPVNMMHVRHPRESGLAARGRRALDRLRGYR